MNPVGSRSIAKEMGFENPYDCDAAGRRVEFQTRLLETKLAWEASREQFVTDRTTLDNLLYSMMHGSSGISEHYVNLACRALQRYEFIVYCPTSVFIDLQGDPDRVASMTYHTLYDAALWGLLHKFRPPDVRLVTMPFAKLEHRKDFLRSMMAPR